MQHFVAGFVIALLAAVPLVVWFFRRKARQRGARNNEDVGQLEELGKLTGELAHEIKNPLSTIKVNLKLAAEELERPGKNDPTATRALRKIAVIQKETDRLEQILDGFLRYVSRPELQLAGVNINELLSDMVDFYLPHAHSYSITVRRGFSSEPLLCKVDADMLKQVVLNLFINAQQAMDGGGELMIRTSKQKENAVIQISDTGSGISPDKLPDIFKPYYSSRPSGSGLGLATAKRIVEAHSGTITVDSEPGKGTSFTISLPLQAD